MEEVKEVQEAKIDGKLFDGINIITSRPEGMEWGAYKGLMKAQKKLIKKYLRGRVFHLSKLYPSQVVMQELGIPMNATKAEILVASQTPGKEVAILLLKGYTYEKSKATE